MHHTAIRIIDLNILRNVINKIQLGILKKNV